MASQNYNIKEKVGYQHKNVNKIHSVDIKSLRSVKGCLALNEIERVNQERVRNWNN